jgi:RsiW-degrading membrane proteinase PrsW (M82 family)
VSDDSPEPEDPATFWRHARERREGRRSLFEENANYVTTPKYEWPFVPRSQREPKPWERIVFGAFLGSMALTTLVLWFVYVVVPLFSAPR